MIYTASCWGKKQWMCSMSQKTQSVHLLSKYIKCSSCGVAVSPSHIKCSSCGLAVSPSHIKCSSCGLAVSLSHIKCSSCGVAVSPTHIKCSSCGLAVSPTHISLLSEEHEGQNMFILTQQVLLYKNVAIYNFSTKWEGNALELCDCYVCTSTPPSIK